MLRLSTLLGILLASATALRPSLPAAHRPARADLRPVLRTPPHAEPGAAALQWLVPLMAAGVPMPALADEGSGFSQVSFYTTLTLYVLAFPGVYSLVKRSVKSKVVRKTYQVAGPAADDGRPLREVAGDITAFFQANNYKIKSAADVIVFEGVQAPLTGRAAFLTFCVFVSLGSLALVLSIFEQSVFGEGKGLGNFWYLSTLVSPIAGKYYLDNAERTDEVTVKIITEDDEMTSDIVVQGNEEEVDRFQKTLNLDEKGMVRVKGIFESV